MLRLLRMPKSISGVVWLAVFAGSLALLSGLATDSTSKASAACGGNFIGYFHGVDYSATDAVASNSVPQVDPGHFNGSMGTNKIGDVSAFVNAVESSPAAQFYIGTMLGNACGGGSASDWASRMQGLKVVHMNYGFNVNSAHWSGSIVTADYPDDYFSYSDSSSADSLVVEDASGQIYAAIKIDCGNIITTPRALPQDIAPSGSLSITCNTNGTATLKATMSDPQGAPSGTAKVGGWSSGTLKNGSSVTVPYNYVENAGSGSMVINNVGPLGSALNKTVTASFPACNKPPTGSASGTCNIGSNAASDYYQFTFSFSDPNGATTAKLTDGSWSQSLSGGSAKVATGSVPRTGTITLVVEDMDDGHDLGSKNLATIARTGNMNCPAKGDIQPETSSTCAVVDVKSWDANAPTATNQFRLTLGTGGSQTYTSNGGQDAGWTSENVSTISNFDPWRINTVKLDVYDQDSGQWSTVKTVTLPTKCDTIACSNVSTQQGWVAGETHAFQLYAKIVKPSEDKSPVQGPPGGKFYASITSSVPGGSKSWGAQDYTPHTGSLNLENSPNNLSYLPPDAGEYTLSWYMADGETNPNPSPTCSEAVQVGYVPFFTVAGGDFAAGPGFGDSCSTQNAGISASNLSGYDPSDYFGSGSQLATLANGNIDGFATDDTSDALKSDISNYNKALASDGTTPHIPTGLMFPSNGSVSGTLYGGGFAHTSGWCATDYYGKYADKATGGAPDYSTPGERIYKLPANSTIGNITVQPGVHVTLVVAGNVYINGPITYASYSVTNGKIINVVPQFSLLISGGNLFIDHNVTNLSGVYDVQPDKNGNGGTLNTCTHGLNEVYVQDFSDCTNQLTVTGAVAAAKLNLGRTHGSLIDTPTTRAEPAEQFIYSPELWLGSVSGADCRSSDTTVCLYQAYTALPPVL